MVKDARYFPDVCLAFFFSSIRWLTFGRTLLFPSPLPNPLSGSPQSLICESGKDPEITPAFAVLCATFLIPRLPPPPILSPF